MGTRSRIWGLGHVFGDWVTCLGIRFWNWGLGIMLRSKSVAWPCSKNKSSKSNIVQYNGLLDVKTKKFQTSPDYTQICGIKLES